MSSKTDRHDKTTTSETAASLEAPLSLLADQLELVAGGLMPTTPVLRPIINAISGQPTPAAVTE